MKRNSSAKPSNMSFGAWVDCLRRPDGRPGERVEVFNSFRGFEPVFRTCGRAFAHAIGANRLSGRGPAQFSDGGTTLVYEGPHRKSRAGGTGIANADAVGHVDPRNSITELACDSLKKLSAVA